MKTLKDLIREKGLALGADMVGFSSMDRFDQADVKPTDILPTCKTVIGLGFRVLRGSLRGIEEGTVYYQYTTMGIELLEETYMPSTTMRLCGCMEDKGFLAAPQKKYQMILADQDGTYPEINYKRIYRGVDMPQLDFQAAAVACGLGEMGASGQVLTKKFGPFQRFCFILTDAELEADPLVTPQLCDQCGKCMAACPGKAMTDNGNRGYQTDSWQCAAYLAGANATKNPFLAPNALSEIADRMAILRGEKHLSPEESRKVMDALHFYPPMKHAYATNVCGRACDRACYVHLEERGLLDLKFRQKFRDNVEWTLDIDAFD